MRDNKYCIKEHLTKSGEMTLEINGYYVHSKYDPIKEAQKYVERHYRPHNLNIIFGYGKGYLIEELEKFKKHNENTIVIDPLLDEKRLAVSEKHHDVLGIEVNDIEHMEFLLSKINPDARTTFNIMCTNNYDKLFPVEYKKLLQKIRDIQDSNRVNDNTLILFSSKWQHNLSMNLNHLTKDASLIELKDKYTKPVIIASSGPSLTKQLDLVKKYRNKIILISAGSTTSVLLNNKIQPDFIVSIDGGEPNYLHFKSLNISNSRLIYSLQNHHKIRESFKEQAFVCNLKGHAHIGNYLKNKLDLKLPTLLAGSTVANLCFSVAQYISKGPIAFIGQDLAYTDNLSHVKGHNHTKVITESNLKDKGSVLVDGYFGDKVRTSVSMNSMRLEFEKMIVVESPKVSFYNCTEGGAKIKGYKQMPFTEFCSKYIEKLDEFEENSLLTNVYPICLEKKQLIDLFNDEIEKAIKTIELYEKAIDTINRDDSIDKFKPKTIRILDKIDEEISDILNDLPTDFILIPTVMEVKRGFLEKENETIYQKYKRVREQNLKLYQSSKEAINKFIEYTKQALLQLEEE